jgi:hypothetical protein
MVRQILNDHPHLKVVGEAPDGAHAIILAEELRPDVVVVVLNVVRPKMTGFGSAPDPRSIAFGLYRYPLNAQRRTIHCNGARVWR